jgi:glycerol-3-phosphate acyltransferase PlsY
METMMTTPIFAVLGYLLGSLPFAVIVSKAFGLADPRSFGSGNPGATNVLRSGNKLAAVLTLIGDVLKGWLAMWLASRFGGDDLAIAVAGFAAFIGHVFPLFLKFKGGKGVATALGVLAGFNAWLALAVVSVWLLVALVTRYSSLAALVAACSAPLAAVWLGAGEITLTAVSVMSVVLIWRHGQNIRRLLAGTEGKLGGKKKQD